MIIFIFITWDYHIIFIFLQQSVFAITEVYFFFFTVALTIQIIFINSLYLKRKIANTLRLSLINNVEDSVVFLALKDLFLIIFHMFMNQEMLHFCRDTTNVNIQFSKTKSWISNPYFFSQSFNGYQCEFEMPLHQCRVILKLRLQSYQWRAT